MEKLTKCLLYLPYVQSDLETEHKVSISQNMNKDIIRLDNWRGTSGSCESFYCISDDFISDVLLHSMNLIGASIKERGLSLGLSTEMLSKSDVGP